MQLQCWGFYRPRHKKGKVRPKTYESLQYRPLLILAHQQTGWLVQIVDLQNIMQEAIGRTNLYTIVKKTEVLHSLGVVWVKQIFMEIPQTKRT